MRHDNFQVFRETIILYKTHAFINIGITTYEKPIIIINTNETSTLASICLKKREKIVID